MKNLRFLIPAFFVFSLLPFWHVSKAQNKPLTYPEIITALNSKLPNKSFRNKSQLLKWLITQIKNRNVDKQLTQDREEDLRQAGATDELIQVIRENSPPYSLSKPVKTPTPKIPATKQTTKPKSFKNSIGMEFVRIPSGSFTIGSPNSESDRDTDEEPPRSVTVSQDFYMGKYEVTQEQWEKVMGDNPSYFKGCPRCPVEQVSWNDAREFIKKLNAKGEGIYRLPSEAEWEYAARAGTTGAFGIGNGTGLSSDQANFDGDYPYGNAIKGQFLRKTTPVGGYQPNAWGLYDMHGNVGEWCEDIYTDSYTYLITDGSANVSIGDSSVRIVRGGSWFDGGRTMRSANRAFSAPANRYYYYGFRLVARPR